jgi:hypothetical protein
MATWLLIVVITTGSSWAPTIVTVGEMDGREACERGRTELVKLKHYIEPDLVLCIEGRK